jgi:hypothetical protein
MAHPRSVALRPGITGRGPRASADGLHDVAGRSGRIKVPQRPGRACPLERLYVDNDPLVLAHIQAAAAGGTDHIDADLNDPAALLRMAREKLDFSRPVP